jgi:hypothetical protein
MPNNKNIIVYTAISNQYNALLNPSHIDAGLDYCCFTDQVFWNRLANNTVWKIRPLPKEDIDPVRLCRMVKILPHLFFPDHEYSVWVDGSINIIGDIQTLLTQYNYPAMLFFKHPKRSCIYQEGKTCIDLGKDDPQVISRQLDCYREQGFPENAGLIESGVLIRRHNDPAVIRVMDEWWREVRTQSRRDQLSFPYVAWRNDFWPTTMGDESVWGSSQVFTLRMNSYHGDKKITLLDRLLKLADTYIMWRFKRKP